jgi:cyclopropane fatty-acyl-phospholipid synthase-like methyltransferase
MNTKPEPMVPVCYKSMSIYADGTYLKRHPTWHSEDATWKADQVIKTLARNKRCSVRTICEVGCGAGQVLVELQKSLPLQTSFFGYEISPDAFSLCLPKSNESLQFKLDDLASANVEPFDLLLVLDVVEHVADYFGFLHSIRDKARYVLFQIPLELTVHSLLRRVLMLNRKVFGHLHYFTKDTALATLHDCGYHVLDWSFTPAVVDLARPGLKSTFASTLRRAGFRMAPEKSVLILGGYALMALTEGRTPSL